MCIIIVADRMSDITDEYIENSMKVNRDGAGFGLISDKGVVVRKFIQKVDEAIAVKAELLSKYGDHVGMFHARIATHGEVNAKNAHPFRVTPSKDHCTNKGGLEFIESKLCVMAHNGVLSGFGNAKYSDTVDFITSVLGHLHTNALSKLLKHVDGKFAVANPTSRIIYMYGNGWNNRKVTGTDNTVYFSNYSAFNYGNTKGYSGYTGTGVAINNSVNKPMVETEFSKKLKEAEKVDSKIKVKDEEGDSDTLINNAVKAIVKPINERIINDPILRMIQESQDLDSELALAELDYRKMVKDGLDTKEFRKQLKALEDEIERLDDKIEVAYKAERKGLSLKPYSSQYDADDADEADYGGYEEYGADQFSEKYWLDTEESELEDDDEDLEYESFEFDHQSEKDYWPKTLGKTLSKTLAGSNADLNKAAQKANTAVKSSTEKAAEKSVQVILIEPTPEADKATQDKADAGNSDQSTSVESEIDSEGRNEPVLSDLDKVKAQVAANEYIALANHREPLKGNSTPGTALLGCIRGKFNPANDC